MDLYGQLSPALIGINPDAAVAAGRRLIDAAPRFVSTRLLKAPIC